MSETGEDVSGTRYRAGFRHVSRTEAATTDDLTSEQTKSVRELAQAFAASAAPFGFCKGLRLCQHP
jgi:hypothetical protein